MQDLCSNLCWHLALNILVLGYLKDCLSLQPRWVRTYLLLDSMSDGQLSFLNREIPLLTSFLRAVCQEPSTLEKGGQAHLLGLVNKVNFQVLF